jgi:hypothetical protein
LQAYVNAGIDLGNKSVAEKYQGQPGEAIGFLWDTFGDCLKQHLPGLATAEEIIKAIRPGPPNALIWTPIPDPFSGLQDLIRVLTLRRQRTAQITDIQGKLLDLKTTLPFSFQWGKPHPLPPPGCLLPEFVSVYPDELMAATHGPLRTSLFPTGTVNLILPRYIKFWVLPPPYPRLVGCWWLYNFIFAIYEVRYEVLTSDEFQEAGRLIERITCRQTTSCLFFKKGTQENILIQPMTKQRLDGLFKLEAIRLNGVRQLVGQTPFTLTLDMSHPHELVYEWKRLSADLVIDDILIKPKPTTPSLQQGQEFELFVKVRNAGDLSTLQADRTPPLSGESQVQVRVSGISGVKDGTITGNGCPPQDCSMLPGDTREIQIPFGWVAPFAASINVRATVDPHNSTDEGNAGGERNNTITKTFPLAIPTLPDPAFKNRRSTGFRQVGPTTLRLWADVSNLSPVLASNVLLRFFVDAPPPIGGLLGEATIASLPGKNTKRVEFDWEVCTIPAGRYFVSVAIDPQDQLVELNNRNNSAFVEVLVRASFNKAHLTTDRAIYRAGEIVSIRFLNGCGQVITLSTSAPWVIKNAQGQVVFAPAALDVITEIMPSQTKEWVWDLRNQAGQQAPVGRYSVELMTMNAGIFTAAFSIQSLTPIPPVSRLAVFMTDAIGVSSLRVMLWALNGRLILAKSSLGRRLEVSGSDTRYLARGVYLVLIVAKDSEGKVVSVKLHRVIFSD